MKQKLQWRLQEVRDARVLKHLKESHVEQSCRERAFHRENSRAVASKAVGAELKPVASYLNSMCSRCRA